MELKPLQKTILIWNNEYDKQKMQNNKCLTEKESLEKVFPIYGMQFIPFEIPNWIVLFSFSLSLFLSQYALHIRLLNKPAYSIIIRIDPDDEEKNCFAERWQRANKTCYIVVKVEQLNEI